MAEVTPLYSLICSCYFTFCHKLFLLYYLFYLFLLIELSFFLIIKTVTNFVTACKPAFALLPCLSKKPCLCLSSSKRDHLFVKNAFLLFTKATELSVGLNPPVVVNRILDQVSGTALTGRWNGAFNVKLEINYRAIKVTIN